MNAVKHAPLNSFGCLELSQQQQMHLSTNINIYFQVIIVCLAFTFAPAFTQSAQQVKEKQSCDGSAAPLEGRITHQETERPEGPP